MSLNANWQLEVRDKVWKDIARLPGADQKRIVRALDILVLDPLFGDVQKMKGEEHTWRRRVGAYRIFYEVRSSERGFLFSE
ncbi:MAG: hypothetical protein Q8R08_04330 [bacterium]|nr:hypothetical protein [bacterium]